MVSYKANILSLWRNVAWNTPPPTKMNNLNPMYSACQIRSMVQNQVKSLNQTDESSWIFIESQTKQLICTWVQASSIFPTNILLAPLHIT